MLHVIIEKISGKSSENVRIFLAETLGTFILMVSWKRYLNEREKYAFQPEEDLEGTQN